MKRIAFLLLSAWIAAACGEESEVFYSVEYPLVRVDAAVALIQEAAAAPAGADPADNPQPGADPSEWKQRIEAEVLERAPVAAGGSYRLEFTRFDGGTLIVLPTAEAEPVAGQFNKTPGSIDLQLLYGGTDSRCTLKAYFVEEEPYTVISFDLTEEYRTLYPEAPIESVTRLEYTTQPY